MTPSQSSPAGSSRTAGSSHRHPASSGSYSVSELAVLAEAVLRRPDLWWTALGEVRRLAPRQWWRSSPHLPLPDRRLWEFRMVTAYGRADAVPVRADVVAFLEWCRATAPSARGRTAAPRPHAPHTAPPRAEGNG